ncbi:hypothetical protein RN333_09300 [Enterobacter kobei]|uniref:hypothetical protein n=1 Tax=Enterobacter kobei TaxID=208224 RepID=UPI0028D81E1E|nr:hypothetical protein [Enterobacter kobei]WNP36367.1 hypothetical protein RN333_09300 [Enterobacter kobei]
MKNINIEVPEKGFVVVDCRSGETIARMKEFPKKGRSLMAYSPHGISFMPLMEGEIIGTTKLFERLIEKARTSV